MAKLAVLLLAQDVLGFGLTVGVGRKLSIASKGSKDVRPSAAHGFSSSNSFIHRQEVPCRFGSIDWRQKVRCLRRKMFNLS